MPRTIQPSTVQPSTVHQANGAASVNSGGPHRHSALMWLGLVLGAVLVTATVSIGYAYWQIAREVDEDLTQLISFIDTRLQTAERSLLELDKLELELCDSPAIERLTEFAFEHPASGIFLTRPNDEHAKVFCTIHGQVSPLQHSRVLARAPLADKPQFELLIVEHLWSGRLRSDLFLDYHGERQYNSVQIPLTDSFAFFEDDNDRERRVVSRLAGEYELTRQGELSEAAQWGQISSESQGWPIQYEAGIGGNRVLHEAMISLPFWLPVGLLTVGLFGYVLRLREEVTAHHFRFHRALDRKEFVGYFQPLVDVRAGKIVGCEVLLRWRKANGAVIPPGHFIPELERSSLIQPVTQQLLTSLGPQLDEILAADPLFRCGVNLVPAQLEQPALGDWLVDFSKTFDCRQLAFEITERLPITDMEAAKHELKRIKALGIEIELDDAGTGYGGAAYLQELTIDVLKIDKLFVDTLVHSPAHTPVLDAYIRLGQSLGLKIIAEGVETEAQSQALLSRGVSLQQGYLFARPLPAAEFVAFYRGWRPQLSGSELSSVSAVRAKKVLP
ncbi:EAL domain-containing protein [Shewanella sp. JM162201]|uniref:EAL domain-containing protein n=1 Tax=Shewanella jiangmenensis TaxID=2837387 RepID=A0ABS5V5K0_9GAMM|nr:EAL domain-containing protein [Shewanella jiangmenensis]MBT1445238.1 EAL domain-containing protein [Shewanella jiangmenensis]